MIGGQFKLGGSQQGAGQTVGSRTGQQEPVGVLQQGAGQVGGAKEGQQELVGVLQQGVGFWAACCSSGVKRMGKLV